MIKQVTCRILGTLVLLATCATAQSPSKDQLVRIPMTAEHWVAINPSGKESPPDVQFLRHEGFPNGVLMLKSGSMSLVGHNFRNGTIEFDMKGLAVDIPGIQFRQSGSAGMHTAEEFYVRTFPDCRASNDCIQYAPVINGFLLWNSYPQYQTQAYILDGWNHIRLIVSGERMNVYINGASRPSLVIKHLESGSKEGGIELHGPAVFANLTIAPEVVEGLSSQSGVDATAADQGFVRQWQFSPAVSSFSGASPNYSGIKDTVAPWRTVTADSSGMVNLNRKFAVDLATPARLIWMRTNISANHAHIKHVELGWLGEVWIFVNGKLMTQGKNFYYPDSERRNPDGRLSLENGSFDVPLHQGPNEVAIAMFAGIHDDAHSHNRYGWGLLMRLEDPSGLTFQRNQ